MLLNDLESLMTRLNNILDRVQPWKKSGARCGGDVALSLIRVHCKDAKEEKLKALQVANTKKLQFQSFMETFIDATTRTMDSIDVALSSSQQFLLLPSEKLDNLTLFASECQVIL